MRILIILELFFNGELKVRDWVVYWEQKARMKDYSKNEENLSHVIGREPRALRQASFEKVLESYEQTNNLSGIRQKKEVPNDTGLPDDLKTGIENLSGYSMDDVSVFYNSSKPAELNALAYTERTDIHIAPGEEKHLPHEAWHIVQQKQGRVQPTLNIGGVNINDNEALEKEADTMGSKSLSTPKISTGLSQNYPAVSAVQRIKKHTKNADGSDGPIKQIYIDDLDESQVLPYLANIEIYGETRPPGSNIEFEAGDKARLEARRDNPAFGTQSADIIEQLHMGLHPLPFPDFQDILNNTLAGRQILDKFPHFIDTFRFVRTSQSVKGFGEWAASKILAITPLFLSEEEIIEKSNDKNISPEKYKTSIAQNVANHLLDYMNELREVELRIPQLLPGETINIAEQAIPGGGKQTADLTTSQGKQIEVKTVREPILYCKTVIHQLNDAVTKFKSADPSKGPYEVVIYVSYSPPVITEKGDTCNITKVNMETGEFSKDFKREKNSDNITTHKVLGNLKDEVLHWLNTSGVGGTHLVHHVTIRVENSTGAPDFNFHRNPDSGWLVV